MRRILSAVALAVALAGLGGLALAVDALQGAGPDAAASGATSIAAPDTCSAAAHSVLAKPTPTREGCHITRTKQASPSLATLGEPVTIALHVRARCWGVRYPVHVVLILDASDAMERGDILAVREAADDLVTHMRLPEYPSTKVGVVAFDDEARKLCPMTNDERRARTAVRRLDGDGAAHIDAGLREAHTMLARRIDGWEPDEASQIAILMSSGHNAAGCGEALRASWQLRASGVLVIAVAVGRDPDERCLRDVASSPRYFFLVENASALGGVFDQIRDRIINVNMRSLEVVDELPPHMAYVPGSADPPPEPTGTTGERFRWRDVYVPREGVTYTLQAVPLATGNLPTNLEARGHSVDNKGNEYTWTFDVPHIHVAAPSPTSSRTPAHTATRTSTPAPTAAGTSSSGTTATQTLAAAQTATAAACASATAATPTASPRPGRSGRAAHLPLALTTAR